mgnify:CR=1 FL=1
MLKNFNVENFRSVKEAKLELAPITFIYGHNAAGKSSIFYALNIARNILFNSAQPPDAFFKLGFFDLGGFQQVVYRHNESLPITLNFASKIGNNKFNYQITLNGNRGSFALTSSKYNLNLKIDVVFPYSLSSNTQQDIELDQVRYKINWNGITANVTPEPPNDDSNKKAQEIVEFINQIPAKIRSVDVVPIRRGFTQVQYNPVNIINFPVDEKEIAAKLAAEPYLYQTLSPYLEEIIDRQFTIHTPPGSGQIRLQTIEKKTKQPVDLVNDGFGVNQLVYLLAKTLSRQAELICIEEPEISLHPAIIRRLPKVFSELVKREDKQLIISTHSADLVLAVLSAVAENKLTSDDVAFYLASREDGITTFKREQINEYGQINGGLSSFLEGEFAVIEPFLKGQKNTLPIDHQKKEEEKSKENNPEGLN